MRGAAAILTIILLAGGVLLAMSSIFIVRETEQAIVLQFGEVVRDPIQEPGLKVKLPWQNVIYLDKRILVHDNPPVTVDVGENERLIVDSFARYRISNPLQFYQTVRTQRRVSDRLKVFLDSSIREVIGAVGLRKVVSGERREIMERITVLVQAAADSARLGIEVVDVRIKRADLPQQNMEAVFNRMRTERQKEAQLSRAKGEQRSREIKSSADRAVTVLIANAQRRSEEIRGEGDRYRNAIFACAFGADPEFFAFYRSMQAYEKSFIQNNTSMVLSPSSEFFRFFGNPAGGDDSFGVVEPGATAETVSAAARNDDACSPDGTYDLNRIEFLTSSAQLFVDQAGQVRSAELLAEAEAEEAGANAPGTGDAAGEGEAQASLGMVTPGGAQIVRSQSGTGAWSDFVEAFPICSAESVTGNL